MPKKVEGPRVRVLVRGPSKCGKTTVALVLKQALEDAGIVVTLADEVSPAAKQRPCAEAAGHDAPRDAGARGRARDEGLKGEGSRMAEKIQKQPVASAAIGVPGAQTPVELATEGVTLLFQAGALFLGQLRERLEARAHARGEQDVRELDPGEVLKRLGDASADALRLGLDALSRGRG